MEQLNQEKYVEVNPHDVAYYNHVDMVWSQLRGADVHMSS